MELAKIRSKARGQAVTASMIKELPLEPSVVFQAAAEVSPSLSSPEPIAAIKTVPPASLQLFQEPVVKFQTVPVTRFDPLSVILDGREHDRIAMDRNGSEISENILLAAAERTFEEFLCFRLGYEEYGINIMEIKEIIKPRELTEVPRTPDFVDGVLSLRGVIVPVFNMRKRLVMLPEYDKSQERIIIVRCGEGLHGLRVDRVTDVVKIAEGGRESTPSVLEGVAREFVGGIGRSDNRMIIILDICKVVDTSLGEVL